MTGTISAKGQVVLPKEQVWFWTGEIQAKVKASEEDHKKGNYKEYSNVDDLLRNLDE
jgi:hypothetical protein